MPWYAKSWRTRRKRDYRHEETQTLTTCDLWHGADSPCFSPSPDFPTRGVGSSEEHLNAALAQTALSVRTIFSFCVGIQTLYGWRKNLFDGNKKSQNTKDIKQVNRFRAAAGNTPVYLYTHTDHSYHSNMSRTHCCRPAAFVVMPPAGEHHHPDESHDEAEDGDEHHPALRVLWHHQRARNQDPHETTEDLQEDQRQQDTQLVWIHSLSPQDIDPLFIRRSSVLIRPPAVSLLHTEAGVWDFCLPHVVIKLLFSFSFHHHCLKSRSWWRHQPCVVWI